VFIDKFGELVGRKIISRELGGRMLSRVDPQIPFALSGTNTPPEQAMEPLMALYRQFTTTEAGAGLFGVELDARGGVNTYWVDTDAIEKAEDAIAAHINANYKANGRLASVTSGIFPSAKMEQPKPKLKIDLKAPVPHPTPAKPVAVTAQPTGPFIQKFGVSKPSGSSVLADILAQKDATTGTGFTSPLAGARSPFIQALTNAPKGGASGTGGKGRKG
jgi:hypothetical protein